MNVLANIALWWLAYVCSVLATGAVLATSTFLPSFDDFTLGEFGLRLLAALYLVSIFAFLPAVIVSAIPEAFGRRPYLAVYGAAGGLTGAAVVTIVVGLPDSLASSTVYLAPLVALGIAGVAGGLVLGKLRTGILRPR